MKSNCVYQRPSVFLNLGNGRYHYNYNVVESTKTGETGEEVPSFDYNTVEIIGKPTYSKVVSAVVREKYTADKEIALINNYNRYQLATTANKVTADKEEYVAYLDEVEAIKAMVKRDCISYNFEIDG